MTHSSIQPQTLKATSFDVPAALLAALVLVLITVQSGAGYGFA